MTTAGFINVLLTLAVVALITTLILPGRQTPQVINAGFTGLSNLTRASQGR